MDTRDIDRLTRSVKRLVNAAKVAPPELAKELQAQAEALLRQLSA